jgi:hypothetical protein
MPCPCKTYIEIHGWVLHFVSGGGGGVEQHYPFALSGRSDCVG